MKKIEKESVLLCKTQTESHDSETVKMIHEFFQFWQHCSEMSMVSEQQIVIY